MVNSHTAQQIISALDNPTLVETIDTDELQCLIDEYPFSEPLIWIYLSKLKTSNTETYNEKLNQLAIYISNRRWLYNILYGDEQQKPNENIVTQPTVTDYFQTMNNEEQKETLTQLAQRLREARLAKKQTTTNTTQSEETIARAQKQQKDSDKILINKEKEAKELLKQKKYAQALEILRTLSADNPKKSIYFAPQIRFIETILENINK